MGLRIFGRLGRNIGFSAPFKADPFFWIAVFIAVLINTCFPQKAHPQQLIVDVSLVGVGSTTVEAILTKDSLLLLPARPVHELFGVEAPTSQWISIQTLKLHWPTLEVTVDLRRLIVSVFDPQQVLPASRKARDQITREGRGAPGPLVTRSGPFLAIAADEREHYVTDFGYSYRGRVQVHGRQSLTFGSQWSLNIAPSRGVYVSYADGERFPATVSGRVAVGPVWVSPTWVERRPISVDGLLAIGRGIKLFASSRDVYVITIQSRAGDFQVGRSRGVMAARLSWGPIPASPFSPPFVP
jgi:hypothetical protein